MIPLPTAAGPLPAGRSSLETIRFPVAGMTCTSCVGHIAGALRRLRGVDRIHVDLRRETVTLRRDPDASPDDVLATAISDAGYQADLAHAHLIDPAEARGLLDRLLRRTP